MTTTGDSDTKGRAPARWPAALALAALFTLPSPGHAFGEERGTDIDSDEHVSSHHLYLTRALAVCAGFSSNGNADPFDAPADAERIAIADQLTDSETLRAAGGVYTHCSAKPYRMPSASDLGCPDGTRSVMPVTGERHGSRLLPIPKWHPQQGCFTSRFGPYSNDFHFPDAARIAVLRDWAFSSTTPLTGTARFSFGGYFDTPWGATCNRERAESIDTGAVQPGSTEAFGIYLHALGDFHSHAPCLAHWGGRRNPPWPTHTISTGQTGCAFIDHAREFGCPALAAHDSVLTPPPGAIYVEHSTRAALDIYDELLRFGAARGITPRLGDGHAQRAWLAAHARRFVTGWSYLGGASARRDFANRLALACATLAPADEPAALPAAPGESNCPAEPAR